MTDTIPAGWAEEAAELLIRDQEMRRAAPGMKPRAKRRKAR